MRTEKDVEAYLLRQGRRFEQAGNPPTVTSATYLVLGERGGPPVAIRVAPPLCVVRMVIAEAAQGDVDLFRRLLELNAQSLVHAAYGLEGKRVVLSAALELENLDFNELAAVLDEIDLAVAQQIPELFQVRLNQGETVGTMGVFSRLSQLIKSNLNDLISRSEDPEKMLNEVVLEMSTQLIEAKKQVAMSIADEKRLQKQAEGETANAAEWERRAMLALKAGNEDLAKEALGRKREHDALAASYQDQWGKQKAAVDQLKRALRMLNDKIEEAKRKKNVLVARKKRAEAQKAIQETMSGLREQSAFETFARMEAKIDQMEAEAEAHGEIANEFSGDVLASRFAGLEKDAGADDELLALKRKMGLAPPEPPRPAPVQARVSTPDGGGPAASDQDELAAALEEMDAEEQAHQRKAGR